MASDVSRQAREEVVRRAGQRCEYCLLAQGDAGFPLQVDHVLSRKHGGLSTSENLACACIVCNRNKGSDIAAVDPVTGRLVRLFHPRQDGWHDHFILTGDRIEPRTSVGRATVRLLRLNAPERLAERRALQKLGRYPFFKQDV